MSIQDKVSQFKGFVTNTDIVLSGLIIVVSIASFSLGRLSVPDSFSPKNQESQALSPIMGETAPNIRIETASSTNTTVPDANVTEKRYVASKSGTKYHLPWCGGAKQIKEENKIWFSTKEEAEKAGYTPAANCKGI